MPGPGRDLMIDSFRLAAPKRLAALTRPRSK